MPTKTDKIIMALRAISVSYNKPCTDEFLEIFTDGLLDIDCDWTEVYKRVVNEFSYMPTLKQLRDVALERSVGNSHIPATKLVNELEKAVTRIGRYNFPRAREELAPEVWALVQELGGWSQCCQTDFKAQGTFVRLRNTAEHIAKEIRNDENFIKKVELEQKKGTNDSRALTSSPKDLNASEGDSSFDVQKALKTAFKSKLEPKKEKDDESFEEMKKRVIKSILNT